MKIDFFGYRGTIEGFGPLIGDEKWHRDDFTPEMLVGGFRPLLATECGQPGDEYIGMTTLKKSENPKWVKQHTNDCSEDCAGSYQMLFQRTKRPLPPPQIETFESHGHVWYKHTPGDKCPVLDCVEVECILKQEKSGEGYFRPHIQEASDWDWNPRNFAGYDIVGFRFPDLPHQEVKVGESLQEQLEHVYKRWREEPPVSVEQVVEMIGDMLFPSEASRCEYEFTQWWSNYCGPSSDMGLASEAWEAAWYCRNKDE